MNRLRQMSVFAHIVEAGSLSAAADTLNLSRSVISQHLKVLEQELGVTLLKRTTRTQSLTPAGQQFYQQCSQINQLADSAWQQALTNRQAIQGPVRITAPHALMAPIIAPAIAQLTAENPLLVPELLASDDHIDLRQQDIDLAIRVGSSQASSLKQRRIGQFRDCLCGTPAQVGQASAGNVRYVANHWQGMEIEHQLLNGTGDRQTFRAQPGCRADSFDSCIALIEAGAGVGLVPEFRFRGSGLVELFPGYQLAANPVYAVHPFSEQLPASVSSCLKAIEAELASHMAGT